MANPLLLPVLEWARRLRYPTLFKLTAGLFALCVFFVPIIALVGQGVQVGGLFTFVMVLLTSVVTMAALLGIPQLGSLFTQGFQLRLYAHLVTGVVLCVVLAVVFDGLIIWANKLATPWRQRTVTS